MCWRCQQVPCAPPPHPTPNTYTLEEHIEISMPLCLLVPIPDFQWQTREWTFLQQSVISCPRVPPTSSPAPSAPVAWIATANGKAAPLTTSKALRLFPWLNLVSGHGHGASRGQLLFLLEEGSSFCKGIRMKDSIPGGQAVGFFPFIFLWIASKREPSAMLRRLLPLVSPNYSASREKEEA